MISNLKVNNRSTDIVNCLEAEGRSSEESNNVTCVQEPKPRKTISPKLEERNDTRKELLDLNASKCMRGQNPHSSRERKILNSHMKEGSVESSTLAQGSRSKVSNLSLRTFVISQLEYCKDKDERYNGLVRILADAGFLQYCYMLIKGKPGNMSKGTTKETLDGISLE